jgi:translation initiation factor 1
VKRKREDRSRTPSEGPFNAPFTALADLRGELPGLPAGDENPSNAEPAEEETHPVGVPARAVVRLERKGRGGKEVTCVEGLGLSPDLMREWLVSLKASLGCGGSVQGKMLILQGDQRERLAELLILRGVSRVVRG